MAQSIDELTIAYTDEEGTQIVKELGKEQLSKGAWVTILYHYQDLDRKNGGWGAPKARIERYQKKNGHYRSQSRFNISSATQARKIAEKLDEWFPADG